MNNKNYNLYFLRKMTHLINIHGNKIVDIRHITYIDLHKTYWVYLVLSGGKTVDLFYDSEKSAREMYVKIYTAMKSIDNSDKLSEKMSRMEKRIKKLEKKNHELETQLMYLPGHGSEYKKAERDFESHQNE